MEVLANILQIGAPVGVDPIGAGLVPGSRCFGPCPGSSSEGFLATFTPRFHRLERGGEVIFSYSLSPKCYFFHETGPYTSAPARLGASTISQDRKTIPTPPEGSGVGNLVSEEEHSRLEIRSNVMTPAPQEKAVPLVNWYPRNQLMRPFGKGRITNEGGTGQVPLGIPVSDRYTKKIASVPYDERQV